MDYCGYIYKFTLKPTNKIYIGKREKSDFDYSYWGSGTLWKAEISKYDKYNDIEREVLEWCYTHDELLEREVYWIDKLNSRDPLIGYNISKGGANSYYGCSIKHTDEWNKKIGDGNRGIKHTIESRKNMSDGQKRYYNEHPEAHDRISEQNKRQWSDKEWVSRLNEKIKIIKSSAYWKEKMNIVKGRPVVNIDTGEIFVSIKSANKAYGKGNILRCVRGERKTACNYHWKYLDDDKVESFKKEELLKLNLKYNKQEEN